MTPNTSNTAAIQVAATTDSGSSVATNLNPTFDVENISSSDQDWVSVRNSIISGANTAAEVSGNGQTWGQRIQAALAAG